jgi:hypothetical protein
MTIRFVRSRQSWRLGCEVSGEKETLLSSWEVSLYLRLICEAQRRVSGVEVKEPFHGVSDVELRDKPITCSNHSLHLREFENGICFIDRQLLNLQIIGLES